ncbi:MAG: acylphosphatase [Candidatus Omnitrophota bacterium]
MIKGKHIFYSGLVQGVGFRFTARHLAKINKLKGWVKNLPDGRVEIIVQGPIGALANFLDQINQEFSSNITNIQAEDFFLEEKYQVFQILP